MFCRRRRRADKFLSAAAARPARLGPLLQTMFHVCDTELAGVDMTINPAKSVCLRIGPNWKSTPVNISTLDGTDILWQQSCRYLGIHIVAGRVFSCSLDNAKRSFYRAFNAVHCKIGGVASEEVVLHLVKSKCMPLLLCGTEAQKKHKLGRLNMLFHSVS